MANTYYDSELTAEEIEAVLEAINGILTQANNGKVLAINNGKIEARSVQWGGGSAVVQPLSVTQNGTYNPPSGVDGYAPVAVNVSGGGSTNVLSGNSLPDSSFGDNGDIYLQYVGAGIKNTAYGQCINTGYSANTNSKLVCDFLVTENQSSEYPTIFGARPNAADTASAISWHMAKGVRDYYGATITWQNQISINGIGAVGLFGKVAHVELENGLFKLTADGINVEQTLTEVSIVSSTPQFLFQMGVNGSPSSFGQTKGVIVYGFKIYENNVLIHDFIPAKDQSDVVCIYDSVADEYKYPNTGTMEYVEAGKIVAAYCKVNGNWQSLIGTNINDVNLGGN